MYAINNAGPDLSMGVEEGGVTGEREAICVNDYHGKLFIADSNIHPFSALT
jgi:hypothetical protein